MADGGKIIYKILGDNSDLAKVLDKVGTLAGQAAKSIGAITAAAAGAVTALATSAIQSYAQYEQLVGGIETLFDKSADGLKNSADLVKKYADEAYKSAGLSANAYMETVTSFSASLLQGLGNDTEAAAEIANMAVVDMADNANKMGTDMQSIQNAYQGFAKSNYTMLDNLKIGYGGTKEEMQRLLTEAERISGIKFDISNFADIVKAIHVIQDNMGITGTTAEEAEKTISGSIASMKAAWQNLMTGMADPTQDFDRLLGNVVDSVATVADNLAPRIMAVLPQMATAVTELAENLLPMIPETLEELLPAVLEGANALISALLDALSQIAATAVPIIGENAGEIIETLVDGLTAAAPMLAEAASELMITLVEAVNDNSGDVTQGAVDIVIALADGLVDCLPELIPAAVDAVLTIAETLTDNIDELLVAAEQIITALADGIINSLPTLLTRAPEIITELIGALADAIPETISFVVDFLDKCANQLVNFDWSEIARTALDNLGKALDNAIKTLQITFDNIFTGGSVYGGDINNVDTSGFVENYQKGAEEVVEAINDAEEGVREAYNDGMEILGRTIAPGNGNDWLAEEEARAERAQAVLDKYKPIVDAKNVASENPPGSNDSNGDIFGGMTESLESELEELENLYATHKVTEEDYWAQRKAILEKYRDDNDPEWWKLYDKVTDHYDTLAETEKKAAEKAAKESEQAAEKAARDRESNLKNTVENTFRDLETMQLEMGYDDEWLREQKRAFIETLDHNSDTYKDYNLKLLQEEDKANDELKKQAQKDADEAAKKAKEASDKVKKAYEEVKKSRDKLASDIQTDVGSLFKSDEKADKRTGEKNKSRKTDTAAFEKKLAAKKKLTSKIAELLDKNVPMSLVKELLKLDPEDALYFANDLLKNPTKLQKLKKDLTEDEDVSNIIANMVTENSDEFTELGTDAGELFGEAFSKAFSENWEAAFDKIFGSEDSLNSTVSVVNSANNTAAQTAVSTPVQTETASTQTATTTAPAAVKSDGKYIIVDVNGTYIATVVNKENRSKQITGGG